MSGTTYELSYLGPDPRFIGETHTVRFLTPVYYQAGNLLSVVDGGPFAFLKPNGYSTDHLAITELVDGKPVGALTYPQVNVLTDGVDPSGKQVLIIEGFGTVTGRFDAYTPCFATGTAIDTPDGPTPVETLRRGDLVTLATGGAAPVRWVGHRRAHDAQIVRCRPGSLPIGPERDLDVSEDHGMAIDGVLVPAGLLVNGETILRERRAEVTFWHVELQAHGILLAEGAPAESYLDTGNRREFGNCPFAYDPVQAVEDPCAEMVLAGERLAAIRHRLRAQVTVC